MGTMRVPESEETLHEKAVLDELGKTFPMASRNLLVTSTKTTQSWMEVTGIAVFLLKFHGKCTDDRIARLIGDVPSAVPEYHRLIVKALAGKGRSMRDRVEGMSDRIMDRLRKERTAT